MIRDWCRQSMVLIFYGFSMLSLLLLRPLLVRVVALVDSLSQFPNPSQEASAPAARTEQPPNTSVAHAHDESLSSTGATIAEQPPQAHQQPSRAPESTAIARGIDSFDDPFVRATTRRSPLRPLRNRLHAQQTSTARLPPRAREDHSPSEAPSALERSQVASSNTRTPHITRNSIAVAAGSRSIYSALYAYPLLALLFIVLSGIICTSPCN